MMTTMMMMMVLWRRMMMMLMTMIIILLTIQTLSVIVVHSLNNDLLRTPPMGWLSWESFSCRVKCDVTKEFSDCISEKLFIQIADAIVEKGYKEVGYDRINIDDCWMSKSRDVESGELLPDPIRFPNGIEYLSNYMHRKGLKLGIYQNYGHKTCMGYPGLLGHSKTDAETFAKWNVDMVKLDGCFTPTTILPEGYIEFGKNLQQTGKKIAYSCSWPYYQMFVSHILIVPNWTSISSNCNMFRVYHDIHAKWDSVLSTIDFMADHQFIFQRITGPGSWPDPDMLLIGNSGLNLKQSEVQMAIWCILPAPLFMSNDPRRISKKYQNILQNREAIRINQDILALPAERVFHNQTIDIWNRQLADGHVTIAVLNRNSTKISNLSLPLHQLQPKGPHSANWTNVKQLRILNVFTGLESMIDYHPNGTHFLISLEPTSVILLRLSSVV